MTTWSNEEKNAVDPCVGNPAVPGRRQLLAQERGVLLLDVAQNGVPAVFVVDLVTVARGVDDGETETDAVLFEDW